MQRADEIIKTTDKISKILDNDEINKKYPELIQLWSDYKKLRGNNKDARDRWWGSH
ncbi:MAG: hypothetical protein V1686_00205 [Patescibacteria group bacterium]